MPILFLSPTDLLFYRHLHGNTVWNCAVFSINYFHSLITNFRRQTFHCWPPREWIVLQRDCIREMSPQWTQKGMKTLCLIYINPNTSFPIISLLNLYSTRTRKNQRSANNDSTGVMAQYWRYYIKISFPAPLPLIPPTTKKKSLLLDRQLSISWHQGFKTTSHHVGHIVGAQRLWVSFKFRNWDDFQSKLSRWNELQLEGENFERFC